jgi:methionine synthase I (cobalamin-dependent)
MNKKVLVVGGHIGTSLMTKLNKSFEDKDVTVVNVENTETVEDLRNTYIEPILIHNSYHDAALAMSLYGEEKKKKKPCTSHEYTKVTAKSEWQCRHCGRLLDQT